MINSHELEFNFVYLFTRNYFISFCSTFTPRCITLPNIQYMKNNLLILLSFALLSVGCYKDIDQTPPPEIIIEVTEVLINTSISGSVVDLEGNFLSGYDLKVNEEYNNVSTDYFLLRMEDLKKKGQTIHVLKDGAQIGIRTQLLVENDINHMEIMQHAPYKQKTISDNNTKMDIGKSLSVDFSSAKYEGGYNGDITVEYIDIESTNSLTPVGYTSLSDLVAVDSKGGFYLSLKTSSNDPVLAAKDSPIILKTSDLDDEVNSLFFFDQKEENWILVTEFTSGDEIEIFGEGYYTFANYSNGVFVEGVVTKEGRPVSYQPMQWDLVSLSNQVCATEKGRWIALLPEKESVEMNLLNPCDESLQTETLDIQVEDIKNQNLIIKDSDNYQSLDMRIFGCDNQIITAPNLNINNGSEALHYVFSDEYQDRWIAVCDEFEIAVFNETTGENGPSLSWSTDINASLNALTDCNDFDEGYSYIKIREDEKIFSVFEIEEQGGKTILKSMDETVKFIFKGNQEGMYNVEDVNVFIDDSEFGEKGYYIKCENSALGCGINNFNVTHYESTGDGIMRASFSGTMWMQTISPSVAGDFDIEGVIVIKL